MFVSEQPHQSILGFKEKAAQTKGAGTPTNRSADLAGSTWEAMAAVIHTGQGILSLSGPAEQQASSISNNFLKPSRSPEHNELSADKKAYAQLVTGTTEQSARRHKIPKRRPGTYLWVQANVDFDWM